MFLELVPENDRPDLHKALSDFLKNPDSSVRSYILRHLSAYFLVEAINVKQETLEILMDPDTTISFDLFLDTNYLFSVLGLHENPSNEAAVLLLDVADQLSATVGITLHVMPITIDETIGTLEAVRASLSSVRPSKNIVNGIIETEVLSGLNQGFFQQQQAIGTLTADSFFSPYIENLPVILKQLGFVIHEEDISPKPTDYEMMEDVEAQSRFEKGKYGQRAKNPSQLRHDISLWYYVDGKRPRYIDSPIDATSWIITVDYRFIAFDKHKRSHRAQNSIPICIHPSSLIQMLQFWLPRTEQFENSLLASMRLPFLFREFDAEAEKMALVILQELSRFEDIDDLPFESIKMILRDKALCQRVSDEGDENTRIELIKDEIIIRINQESKREIEQKDEEIDRLRQEVILKTEQITSLEKTRESQSREVSVLIQRLQEERDHALTRQNELQERVRALEERSEQAENRKRNIRLFLWWLILPFIIITAASIGIVHLVATLLNRSLLGLNIALPVIIMFVWTVILEKQGESNPNLASWEVLDFIRRHRKELVWALLAAIVFGIVESLSSEWARELVPGFWPEM